MIVCQLNSPEKTTYFNFHGHFFLNEECTRAYVPSNIFGYMQITNRERIHTQIMFREKRQGTFFHDSHKNCRFNIYLHSKKK